MSEFRKQAERLCQVLEELVRLYQFRDRDTDCCAELSISQCYALQTVQRLGPISMSGLARELFLEVSSVTRIVDDLVAKRLVERENDPGDRRVCLVRIGSRGESLAGRIHEALVDEQARVLKEVPPESREAVIEAMFRFLQIFKERQGCISLKEKGCG